ncbi:heme NO-binding domain-containing protein [Cognatishimia maritima]|uniref:Haem-NO-binding n=1 Tax=Cognatishimia maritima TaxID=870908 RepID=A0A1M5UC42_9RHOB|nr:heme NO-binding domain-containing protein [Cognatishimia maritima]SHH60510.1 Haem-NO-binding [Cognatishimia maritima]
MHGLVNRAIQCFVRDTYSDACWRHVARRAGLEQPDFEAMLDYDDVVTDRVIAAISTEFSVPVETILEDIGTYLVSHPNVEALRRLLRFTGTDFREFLYSLDDLKARARLALADLDIPNLELRDYGPNHFNLICHHHFAGISYVVMGILRTMADDYGALVLLENESISADLGLIRIQLVDDAFAEGRQFHLGAHHG